MNALFYSIGCESEDIFTSFTCDDGADQNNYHLVKEKFDKSVENFITDLYSLGEFCEYGSLGH